MPRRGRAAGVLRGKLRRRRRSRSESSVMEEEDDAANGFRGESSSSNELMEDDDMDLDDEDESEMLRSHPLLAFLSSEFVALDSSATALNASTSLCCTLRSELATAYLFYFCKIYRRDCPSTPSDWVPKPGTPHWFTMHASDVLRKARSSLGIHLVFRMRRKWINGEFVYGRWCFGAQVDPVLLVNHADPSQRVSTRRQAAEQILAACQSYVQELQDAGTVPRDSSGARQDEGLASADLVHSWPSAFVYEKSSMVPDTDADSQESSDFASSSATPSSEDGDSSSSDGELGDAPSASRASRSRPRNTPTAAVSSSSSSSAFAGAKNPQASAASSGAAPRHRKRTRSDIGGGSGADEKRRKACKELVWDGKRWRAARRSRSRTGVKDERSRPLRTTVRSIFGMLQDADDEAVAHEMFDARRADGARLSRRNFDDGSSNKVDANGAGGDIDDDNEDEGADRMGFWPARRPTFSGAAGAAARTYNVHNDPQPARVGVRQLSSSSASTTSSKASTASSKSASSRRTAFLPGHQDARAGASVGAIASTSSSSSSSTGASNGPPGAPLSSAMSTTSTASAASMTSAASAGDDIAHPEFDAWLDRHQREFASGKLDRLPWEGGDYFPSTGTRLPPRAWDEGFTHMGHASLDYVTTSHAPWYKRDAYHRLDDRGPINVRHARAHARENFVRTAMDGFEGAAGEAISKSVAEQLRSQSATVSLLAAQGVNFTRALLKQMLYIRSLRSLEGNSEILDVLLLLVAVVRVVPHFGLPPTFVDRLASECVTTLQALGHQSLLADLLQRATSEGLLRCLAAVRPKREHVLNPCERKELRDNFTVVRDLLMHVTG